MRMKENVQSRRRKVKDKILGNQTPSVKVEKINKLKEEVIKAKRKRKNGIIEAQEIHFSKEIIITSIMSYYIQSLKVP